MRFVFGFVISCFILFVPLYLIGFIPFTSGLDEVHEEDKMRGELCLDKTCVSVQKKSYNEHCHLDINKFFKRNPYSRITLSSKTTICGRLDETIEIFYDGKVGNFMISKVKEEDVVIRTINELAIPMDENYKWRFDYPHIEDVDFSISVYELNKF